MQQNIKLKYLNEKLNIGMVSWREVYLLSPELTKLFAEVDKGRLVYRAKGSDKRISYQQIKSSLIKTTMKIIEEVPSWI
ncbi:MAG TPA: hypothetical protein VMY77_08565 [Chitinophagaceae bacterium]|nr:hypothetical protein [Chitinophagaceae bacterium]